MDSYARLPGPSHFLARATFLLNVEDASWVAQCLQCGAELLAVVACCSSSFGWPVLRSKLRLFVTSMVYITIVRFINWAHVCACVCVCVEEERKNEPRKYIENERNKEQKQEIQQEPKKERLDVIIRCNNKRTE